MDRTKLMEQVAAEAFAQRIGLSQLCHRAGISRTVAYRWLHGNRAPTLVTIGKLERQLGREA